MTRSNAGPALPAEGDPSPAPRPPSGPDARPARGCLPTVLVLLAMFGLVGSGSMVAEAVADLPSPPVHVAQGISISPVGHWEFGGRTDEGDGVLLSKGNASLLVQVRDVAVRPEDAITALFTDWQRGSEAPLAFGPVEPLDLGADRPAARASYSGAFEGISSPVEGEVTAIQGSRATVVFDAWTGFGEFAQAREEISRMIAGTSIP